ncbi:MAG: tRNA threonylcarbamoyladenosine dehydratase [Paludibacteraceae bacterium]|nr:tRNA threonylcarbamoyladenosine dehydratase [Paludibacteraceae bacterium]
MIMDDFFSRSEALLGAEAMKTLRTKRVIIFGVGGVGSWCAEALVRTGLTHLTIVDGDTVQPSNINRQLPATRATLGMPKVEALKERLLSINPDAEIEAVAEFYHDDDENLKSKILHHQYLIDAIDSVDDKVHLILYASRVRGMKVFSSMGAALRFDPTQVTTGELMTIQGDALAKAVRARMKKIGLHLNKKIRCVYSTEQAQRCETRGSLMQVTATFGLTLASLVIRDLTSQAKL